MLVAIPVEEKSLEAGVCISFGRTPYFMLYNLEKGEYSFVENSAANSQGGAGIKAAQKLVDLKVDKIITFRCGENAATVLKGGNIKLYKAKSVSIKENIQGIKDNSLEELKEIHAGFHNHGGNK